MSEILAARLGEARSQEVAVTNTAARVQLPLATRYMQLTPKDFAGGATELQFNLNPWLEVLVTADLLASKPTRYSEEAQDGSTSTKIILDALDTLANLDAIFIGALHPFGGLDIDISAGNDNASVMSVDYWNGSAWADISPTDGTDVGGDTLKQDGAVTWTVPSAWATAKLRDAVSATALRNLGGPELYWVRLSFSAALDAEVELNSILAINRDANYDRILAGMYREESVRVGPGGIGGLTVLTDAGTCSLEITERTGRKGRF